MVAVSDMTHPSPTVRRAIAIEDPILQEKWDDSLGILGPLRLTIRSIRPPQPHVKRAFSPMTDVGILKSDHKRPEFRERKPHRHLTLKHPTFAAGFTLSPHSSFAGDHQHGAGAVPLSTLQKVQKCSVRLFLGVPVQVDAGIDRITAARHALFQTSPQ